MSETPRPSHGLLEREYPALRARARRRGAKIFFGDAAGIRSDSVLGRTGAPKGKTPEVRTSGQRQSVNAISKGQATMRSTSSPPIGSIAWRVLLSLVEENSHSKSAGSRGGRSEEARVIEGCGHWTQQERPEDVNAVLVPWLSGLKGRVV